jgi:hypothetical protein
MSTPADQMETTPLALGVAEATAENPEEAQRLIEEAKRVAHLLGRAEEGRKFDEFAYAAMAKDRLYARGITGSRIKVNLIASFIGTWVDILYARDPDVDVTPADAVSQKNSENARLFAKTLEVVIVKVWKRGKIKRKARRWVRAALTVGIGWLRVTWQQRTMQDAMIRGQMMDIQDNLKKLASMKAEMDERGEAMEDYDSQKLEYDETLEALEAKVEKVISRGMAFDFYRSEDIVVSPEVETVMDYLDAPWIDIRTFKTVDHACAEFPDIPRELMESATIYGRRPMIRDENAQLPGTTLQTANDADMFAQAAADAVSNKGCGGGFVCIHEQQDRDTGMIYTMIEGVPRYARPPIARSPYATRFYDVFALSFTETDGLRYPQSLNTRSHTLQDEYTNLESRLATHRQRVIPKIIFNKKKVSKTAAKTIAASAIGEMVGIEVVGNIDLSKLLFVPAYPNVDPGLYDTTGIQRNLEIVWGTQEAVMGSVTVAKTATEAKIQEAGTGARTTSKRDTLDDELSEIAQYSAELLVQVLDQADARSMAGSDAIWPTITKPEELDAFVSVEIRAGSSGKPDTAVKIEQWTQELPILSTAIKEIGALRRSDPLQIADCLEALVEETVDRFGDRIDLARMIPQLPEMIADPLTGQLVPKHLVMSAVAGGGMPTAAGAGGMPVDPSMPIEGGEEVPGMSTAVGPDNVQSL